MLSGLKIEVLLGSLDVKDQFFSLPHQLCILLYCLWSLIYLHLVNQTSGLINLNVNLAFMLSAM